MIDYEDHISRADLIKSFLADNECEREEAEACMCSLGLMLELIEDAPSVVPTIKVEPSESFHNKIRWMRIKHRILGRKNRRK